MTETRNRAVIAIYASIAVAFIVGNWRAGIEPNLNRWPDVGLIDSTNVTHAGLDRDRLDRSVQRLPSIRFLRMLGNNFRILLGQRLEWIVWGEEQDLPVMAPKNELGVSRGLRDQGIKSNLEQLIRRLAQYSRKLEAEGWELYVVPIPPKLSIYREYFPWPLHDTDQRNRQPIDADHSTELLKYLGDSLAARGVRYIDLQTPFREASLARTGEWLYPPGESHWSGHGIEFAATITATGIARQSQLAYVPHPQTTELPVVHIGDIIKSMDAFPMLMGRYRSIYRFTEALKRWPVYTPEADKSAAADAVLLAVLGTSYTGHYGWLVGEPVGFAQAVGAHLHHACVYQISQTGIGGFHPFRTFLERKDQIDREFRQRTGQSAGKLRKIVVWEFPIRDFGYLTAHSEAWVLHIDNPFGVEQHLDRSLFWLGPQPATISVFASEDGVVEFAADLQPGPALRPGAICTLVISDEAGQEFHHRIVPGSNKFRIPVLAGANKLFWHPLETPDILPPYANGDPRTLMLSVFNLSLSYEQGAVMRSALSPSH